MLRTHGGIHFRKRIISPAPMLQAQSLSPVLQNNPQNQSTRGPMSRLSANFVAPLAMLAVGICSTATSPAQMQMPACHPMPAKTDLIAPESLPPPQKLTGIGN